MGTQSALRGHLKIRKSRDSVDELLRSRLILQTSLAMLLVVSLVSPTCRATCSPSDSLTALAGDGIEIDTMMVAPNANGDLLVAGHYTDYVLKGQAYMFFFKTSDCTVPWSFNGADDALNCNIVA